jgi:hypothetical protein
MEIAFTNEKYFLRREAEYLKNIAGKIPKETWNSLYSKYAKIVSSQYNFYFEKARVNPDNVDDLMYLICGYTQGVSLTKIKESEDLPNLSEKMARSMVIKLLDAYHPWYVRRIKEVYSSPIPLNSEEKDKYFEKYIQKFGSSKHEKLKELEQALGPNGKLKADQYGFVELLDEDDMGNDVY